MRYKAIWRTLVVASAALLTTAVASCSLEVSDPEVVDPGQLDDVEATRFRTVGDLRDEIERKLAIGS